MAKKKAEEKTLKELLLEVIHACNDEYKSRWKASWDAYKTVIGPFIKGTFSYLWTLVYGSLKYVGEVIYGCGKVLYEALIKLIEKA